MALPGLGTIVRYHYSTGIDIPAVVVATPTGWNSDLTTYYGSGGPGSGEVYLLSFQNGNPGGGLNLFQNIVEGTAVGQFSLLATEAEDQ